MIGLAISLGLISTMSSSAPSESSADALAKARTFLEAFAANPSTARRFVTNDAGIIVGDIGGPYNDYVKALESEATWLRTCRVGHLHEKRGPTADELKDGPPRYRGGRISVVEGTYMCTRPDALKTDIEFTVILKADQVVELQLGGAR